jgi:hypothetical protein
MSVTEQVVKVGLPEVFNQKKAGLNSRPAFFVNIEIT